MHLVRDIIAAVVGGLIVLVIGLFVTNATRTELVWVYVGAIVMCVLVLGALQLPGLMKRRRAALKAEIIAAAKEQILAELGSLVSESRRNQISDAKPAAIHPSGPLDVDAKLVSLLEEGRMLQGGLRSAETANSILHGDEAVAIGRWEGRARTTLMRWRDFALRFDAAPGWHGIGLSHEDAYKRMDEQLKVLEWAVHELEERGRVATSADAEAAS